MEYHHEESFDFSVTSDKHHNTGKGSCSRSQIAYSRYRDSGIGQGNRNGFTDRGSIEIGCDRVVTDNYPSLQFFVKDTGIGISPEKKDVIFERFRQSDELHNRPYEGAGLGLSISKSYVEMLGGKIWLESEPESGSAFYFTIPLNTESKQNIEEEELLSMHTASNLLSADHAKRLTVLIVEDDEASEMFLTLISEKFSKKVLKAFTGNEAVQICRYNPDIDFVLMDVRMPDVDGYEATRQIRQFNREVIIIAQTAFALTGEREKAIEAGCNDYIPKPIKQAELKELIIRHCIKLNQ